MSGIMNRIHVFKRNNQWWIEDEDGWAIWLPGHADLNTVMNNAILLHDQPHIVLRADQQDAGDCPLCIRRELRTPYAVQLEVTRGEMPLPAAPPPPVTWPSSW